MTDTPVPAALTRITDQAEAKARYALVDAVIAHLTLSAFPQPVLTQVGTFEDPEWVLVCPWCGTHMPWEKGAAVDEDRERAPARHGIARIAVVCSGLGHPDSRPPRTSRAEPRSVNRLPVQRGAVPFGHVSRWRGPSTARREAVWLVARHVVGAAVDEGIIEVDAAIRWNYGTYTADAERGLEGGGGNVGISQGDGNFDTLTYLAACCETPIDLPEGWEPAW